MSTANTNGVAAAEASFVQDLEGDPLMHSERPICAIGGNVLIRPNCEAFSRDRNDLDSLAGIRRRGTVSLTNREWRVE
jgi:hypothetical protein